MWLWRRLRARARSPINSTARAAFTFVTKNKISSENTPTQSGCSIDLEQLAPTKFFLQVKEEIWLERSAIFRILKLDSRALCLLVVGRIYGRFGAILPTVQWCQVAQVNTRYVPRRYRPHILYHIGHWRSFGHNWWSPISGPCLRSVLRVVLRVPNKPCVQWEHLNL